MRWRIIRGVAGVLGVLVIAGGAAGFGGIDPVSGEARELAFSSGREVVLESEEEYSDIADAGVHRPDVEALQERGIFEGTDCGPGKFCPTDPVPRWVIAVWLVRAVEAAEPDPARFSRFSDVVAGEWWLPYVQRLADLRITQGCEVYPARFCSNDPVTREQMASFLDRAFQLEPAPTVLFWSRALRLEPAPGSGFVDVLAPNPHQAAINALAAAGITVGCATEPARYCPASPTTRAQMATFLVRALGMATIPQTVTPAPIELSALGETVQLIAELRDESGDVKEGAKFSWESSDDAVATVTATVLLTAVGNGAATITATAGSASGMAPVAAAQAIAYLAVEPAVLSPAYSGTQVSDTIVVTDLDGGGSPVVNASYRWSTDRHSGWVYPREGITNALGRLHATWAAGWPGEGAGETTVDVHHGRIAHLGRGYDSVDADPQGPCLEKRPSTGGWFESRDRP